MTVARTEQSHEEARGLDIAPPEAVLDILLRAQVSAAEAVRQSIPALARAAELAAAVVERGGRLGYAAAGSSGLMALADGLELPGTYGIPRERIEILIAGGEAALRDLAGGYEDDAQQAQRDVDAAGLGQGDCVIGISASGSTPYTVAALRHAEARGAATVAVANNAGAAMFDGADVAVLVPTPPEVIAGSTRMGAGTAQKIALNMLSTLMAIRLGHVHDGHMIGVVADNGKLKARAARIVAEIAGCDADRAETCLEAAGGSVKMAVLMAAGAGDAAAAREILEAAGHRLRPALSMIEGSTRSAIMGRSGGR
jgi:N-acetylmuramic acid 6-phosphate etherase